MSTIVLNPIDSLWKMPLPSADDVPMWYQDPADDIGVIIRWSGNSRGANFSYVTDELHVGNYRIYVKSGDIWYPAQAMPWWILATGVDELGVFISGLTGFVDHIHVGTKVPANTVIGIMFDGVVVGTPGPVTRSELIPGFLVNDNIADTVDRKYRMINVRRAANMNPYSHLFVPAVQGGPGPRGIDGRDGSHPYQRQSLSGGKPTGLRRSPTAGTSKPTAS